MLSWGGKRQKNVYMDMRLKKKGIFLVNPIDEHINCLALTPFDLNLYNLTHNELLNEQHYNKVWEYEYVPIFYDGTKTVKESKLIPVRERPDKIESNNIVVLCYNVSSIINPVSIHDLFDKVVNPYFSAVKDLQYMSITKIHNEVKRQIYNKFIHADSYIVDVGSGIGQDIKKYIYLKPRFITCIDPVLDSLVELQD